jgi:indole-3-glycerol phosphate synthase
MEDILKKICNDRKLSVAQDKKKLPLQKIIDLASNIDSKSDFLSYISSKYLQKQVAIIAEIKHKSPSQGKLTNNFDVAKIAESYNRGGAACISVLTEPKYFSGDDAYIGIAKKASNLPVLRKDFIIDPYQIYQAKYLGSDAILLIMSALSLMQAKEYESIAHSLNMDVLIETHNQQEIEQALQLKSKLIGVNNRNLKTLDISLDNIKELKNLIPQDRIIICESGINSKTDLQIMLDLDIYVFLIGGYLMNKPTDIEKNLSQLVALR